jgi:type II secretory pathway component PulC
MKTSQRSFLIFSISAVIIVAWFVHFPLSNPKTPAPAAIPQAQPSTQITATATPIETVVAEKPITVPGPDIVLHGTFINNLVQQALISSDGEEDQRWFSLGQTINGDFYLNGIFKDHIIVRDAADTVALEIRITTGGATQELTTDPVPPMPPHAWVESLPPVPGIDRLESNHYRVQRELIMKELQSGEIFKQVRILPKEDGGFFVDRIRRGSLAEVVGLQVGDTIHKINDKPMTNITDVLELYKNLDTLEKVDVEINRMREVQHLRYELN